MLLLTLPTFLQGRTARLQGALLIGIYGVYCWRLFQG
jgi:hypothetical protein